MFAHHETVSESAAHLIYVLVSAPLIIGAAWAWFRRNAR